MNDVADTSILENYVKQIKCSPDDNKVREVHVVPLEQIASEQQLEIMNVSSHIGKKDLVKL